MVARSCSWGPGGARRCGPGEIGSDGVGAEGGAPEGAAPTGLTPTIGGLGGGGIDLYRNSRRSSGRMSTTAGAAVFASGAGRDPAPKRQPTKPVTDRHV